MIVKEYLKSRLTGSANYSLSEEDKRLIGRGMEEFILARLMSKKFRKQKVDDSLIARTKKIIGEKIRQGLPLRFVFPMGGYKLWRLPSSPEADFAEFFNVAYLLEYLAPIVAAYKKGSILYYYIHTLLMEFHDNLTTEEISRYVSSFETILKEFSRFLPENFQLRVWRDSDLYTREEYAAALKEGLAKAEDSFAKMDERQKDHYFKLGRLNIKWQGKEDWERLTAAEKEEKVHQGILYELAAVNNLIRVNETVKSEDNILFFVKSTPLFIGVGTTKNSVTKHWTGIGVLEREGGKFYDRVLSPSQYEAVKDLSHEVVEVNLEIPLENLRRIRVFDQRFNFSYPKR